MTLWLEPGDVLLFEEGTLDPGKKNASAQNAFPPSSSCLSPMYVESPPSTFFLLFEVLGGYFWGEI